MEGTKDTKGMFGIKGIKWYRVSIEMIYSKNQDYKVFKPCKVVFLNHIPFISFIPPLYVQVSQSKNFMIFHDFCYNSDCFLSILSILTESGGKIKMDGIKGIIGIKGMFGIKGIQNIKKRVLADTKNMKDNAAILYSKIHALPKISLLQTILMCSSPHLKLNHEVITKW